MSRVTLFVLGDALHVDERGGAGHRDGLLDGADRHFGVDVRRDTTGQLNLFPHERAEPGQGKRDGVGSAEQLSNLVQALTVGDGGPDPSNQSGARRFHRDTRQHATGAVRH